MFFENNYFERRKEISVMQTRLSLFPENESFCWETFLHLIHTLPGLLLPATNLLDLSVCV